MQGIAIQVCDLLWAINTMFIVSTQLKHVVFEYIVASILEVAGDTYTADHEMVMQSMRE